MPMVAPTKTPSQPGPRATKDAVHETLLGAFHSERVVMGHGLHVSPPPDPREAVARLRWWTLAVVFVDL